MRKATFRILPMLSGFPCEVKTVEVVGETEVCSTVYHPDMKGRGHSAIHDYGIKFVGTKYERNLWHVHKDFLDIIEIPATLENK